MRRFWKITLMCVLACVMVNCKNAKNEKDAKNAEKKEIKALNAGEITVATINTDTLFAEYQMVKDVTNELERTEKKLQTDLQNQAQSFQKEYENYLKVGASMTLSEQKKKEEYLTRKKEGLEQLSARYSEQIMTMRMSKMQEVQDKIFGYIKSYNESNNQYTFVISNARTSGVLYSPANIDITQEILDAINAEYKQERAKK